MQILDSQNVFYYKSGDPNKPVKMTNADANALLAKFKHLTIEPIHWPNNCEQPTDVALVAMSDGYVVYGIDSLIETLNKQ